jgi:cyclic-di-AMP phosphodiesterase PgpH
MSSTSTIRQWWQKLAWRTFFWLFIIILTLGLSLILSFNLVRPNVVAVSVNAPAPVDIDAPYSLTFTSEARTQQAREQARNNVEEAYTAFDFSIGRDQLNKARAVFNFVDVVRADTQSTVETKLNYLQAIEGLLVEEEVALDLLNMGTADYEIAKADIFSIIDDLMRQEIRETQLRDMRLTARRQASLDLTTAQNEVVTNLAPQFIVPTVFPNVEETERRRAEAAASVEPVTRSISRDQRIVRAGDIVTEADLEVLDQYGLLQQENDWRDIIASFLVAALAVLFISLYWQQFHIRRHENMRYLAALGLIILLFALAARIMVSAPGSLTYLFPLAAMSMLLAVMYEMRFAIFVTLIMAGLVGYMALNSLELTMYMAVGGLMAILTLRDAQRVNAFFRAGLMASAGHIGVIIIFHLPQNGELWSMVEPALYGLTNGILSAALTLAGFFLLGSLFGMITILQLQDLSRLDHPLLQELLRKAPGTYHHSIMVANLAEQAAERTRANSTLVRVGAFYHDIGKMKRPPFFTENQEGINPHDALDPYSSARIIVSHVSDGLEMARRYRLPDRIRDFIAEHHGDRVVKGFYMKARADAADEAEADAIDVEKFRHKGPRPGSRETGIVMLADAVEATSSAVRPNTERAIEKLINSLVDEHVMEGQLDESGLTLGDIKQIRASFIETLKGRFHVRVRYPGNEEFEMENIPTAGRPPAADLAGGNGAPVEGMVATETPIVSATAEETTSGDKE